MSLHAATGAAMGAAVRSRLVAGTLGPLLDAATVGAFATCAPDLEHVIRLPRPGGSKLFHDRRGWHRSGGIAASTQLLLAGIIVGWLWHPHRAAAKATGA